MRFQGSGENGRIGRVESSVEQQLYVRSSREHACFDMYNAEALPLSREGETPVIRQDGWKDQARARESQACAKKERAVWPRKCKLQAALDTDSQQNKNNIDRTQHRSPMHRRS